MAYSLGIRCVAEFLGMIIVIYTGEAALANELLPSTKGHAMGWCARMQRRARAACCCCCSSSAQRSTALMQHSIAAPADNTLYTAAAAPAVQGLDSLYIWLCVPRAVADF